MAKVDDGFKQTDEMLKDLESKIHKEYEQAAREITEKANKYFARFQNEDDAMRDAWQNGEITKKEYAEWRTRKMQRGQYYTEMKTTLARDLVNTDKIAMSYVNDRVIDVYALNMNYGTYSIEKDSKINTSFSLYNRSAVQNLIKNNPQLLPSPKVDIPADMKWNQQHIQSAITQGILQGKSIPEIAKNLQSVTGMDERAALRNARTAMTGAQNAGRLDSMKRAAARGVAVKKGWLATLDHVTRDSHVDLDGEVQELDKTFSNGLMYPADGTGAPEEVYNCRCRLTHEYDKYKTDWSNPANRNTSKLGSMSYKEWKDNHKEKAAKIRARQRVQQATSVVSQFVVKGFSEKRTEKIEHVLNSLCDEYESNLKTVESATTTYSGVGVLGDDMTLKSTQTENIVHEFAHTLANTTAEKTGMQNNADFWKEIKKVRTEYRKARANDNTINISGYANMPNERIDEFMAEAFTLAKMSEWGVDDILGYGTNNEFSKKVLEIVNKYFKRA